MAVHLVTPEVYAENAVWCTIRTGHRGRRCSADWWVTNGFAGKQDCILVQFEFICIFFDTMQKSVAGGTVSYNFRSRGFSSAAKQHCNLREFFVLNRHFANTLFLLIYHKVSQYTCHCNYINTIRKVRTEFSAVILAEHTRAQQY
jgi:hypothetical protein